MTKAKKTVLVTIIGDDRKDLGTHEISCSMSEHFNDEHLKQVHDNARNKMGLKKRSYVLAETIHADLELEKAMRAHFNSASGAMYSEQLHNPMNPAYDAYSPISIGGHAVLYREMLGDVKYAKVNFDWVDEKAAMAPVQAL